MGSILDGRNTSGFFDRIRKEDNGAPLTVANATNVELKQAAKEPALDNSQILTLRSGAFSKTPLKEVEKLTKAMDAASAGK
jgi:hypothetical protein